MEQMASNRRLDSVALYNWIYHDVLICSTKGFQSNNLKIVQIIFQQNVLGKQILYSKLNRLLQIIFIEQSNLS